MKYRQTDTKYVAQPTLPSNPLVTKLRHFLNQLLRRRIMQNRLHATVVDDDLQVTSHHDTPNYPFQAYSPTKWRATHKGKIHKTWGQGVFYQLTNRPAIVMFLFTS